MNWSMAHRTLNTILILLIALALFATVDKLICTIEQEHTVPQCEMILLEELRGDLYE